MRKLLLLLLPPVLVLAAAWGGLLQLPPRWDPFAPLDLRAEPNFMTGPKLARMDWQGSSCFAAFEASGLPLTRLPDSAGGQCPLEDVVRMPATEPALAPAGPVATCAMAASWELFARFAVQPAALAHLGQRVVRVRQLGTFSCRPVRTDSGLGTRLSQHGRANALDVAGFVLEDGREVSVARDWNDPGPRGAFLRDAHRGACRFFNAVLGPDYNNVHRDHFHLDRGPWRACR
ncbi:extensin-like domain-containing protein [Roseomonas elaeocarpi]|uniref:Extensin family protein n=1 Tax=Roseomonas elaeocarpi TaxID=907779 RepID=A0ABV6JUI5_9PROT